MSLVIANALLLILVLVELMVIAFHKKEAIPWREVIFNLNSGHILMWIFRGLEVAIFHMISTQFGFGIVDNWNYLAIWVFTFFAWDFCFYWLHRIHHQLRFLWAVHVVHHEGEHYGLSLGIRNSWYSSLTSIPFFIVLALMSVPVEIFLTTSSIHYFIQFYNHNNIVRKSGFLEKILITPSHHRVHHGLNDEYVDRNFGGTFVFWDKLFGTFQEEMEAVPVQFGTRDNSRSTDIIKANNLPFIKLFRKFKPDTPTPAFSLNQYFIAVGGVLLFLLLLYYIFQENTWDIEMKAQLFVLVFMGTIANGGLSEGRNWGVILWSILFITLGPLFIYFNELNDLRIIVPLAALSLHAVSCLVYLGKSSARKLAPPNKPI
ncbi:MAG: sterol desaturase family protein [Marinoscillum sp.]